MAYLSLMGAPCLGDFTILHGLGEGSSGTVHLVREEETGGLYALKAMPKRKPCGKQLRVESVIAERNTLLDLRGDDLILQLRACFHDSTNYYLVTVRHVTKTFGTPYSPRGCRNTTLLEISTLFYC
jgi:hypothetical protein